jgi:hypothetical protein
MDLNWSKMSSKDRFDALRFSTPAYYDEALRLVISEAERVAGELRLQETLPIRRMNLVASYITPPRMAQSMGAIGNITTSNYVYYISVGNRFSFLTRECLEHEYSDLRSRYLWPTNLMDTNAAYQMATQFLAAVSMDVRGLDRDCTIRVDAFMPEGRNAGHFVPIYWVYWITKGQGTVALVELLLPTRTIRQLRVNSPRYILRKPLKIENLESLLEVDPILWTTERSF